MKFAKVERRNQPIESYSCLNVFLERIAFFGKLGYTKMFTPEDKI